MLCVAESAAGDCEEPAFGDEYLVVSGLITEGSTREVNCAAGYTEDSFEVACVSGAWVWPSGAACEEIDPCANGTDTCEFGTCMDNPPPANDYVCSCWWGHANPSGNPYTCEGELLPCCVLFALFDVCRGPHYMVCVLQLFHVDL